MDADRVKGTTKQAEGSAKEGLGKVSGDVSLKAEGKAKKTEGSLQEGSLQKAFGKMKDALRKR